MAQFLVEDPRARSDTSVGAVRRWYRTVSCPAGAVATLMPARGSAMPSGYDGDTDAKLVSATPGVVGKTGQVRIRLVYAQPLATSGAL